MRPQRPIVLALSLALSLGLSLPLGTACATATEPIEDPEVPVFSTPPPPGAAEGRDVPATCDEVVTAEEIGRILGILLTGRVHPVVGVPEEAIGRTARLDCYFGLRQGAPYRTATVWIALATYTDAAAAARRVSATAADERAAGARVSDVPVGLDRGVLLRGEGAWTLAAVRGRTTVVVTVAPDLVREDHVGALLGQLADRTLTAP